MRREDRQRRLARAFQDEIVAPGGVDRRVVAEAAEPAAGAEIEVLAVETDRLVERESVAHHHALDRLDRQLAIRALVVAHAHALAIDAREAASMAAVGQDALVE